MNLKYYLRGLGIGILVTAIIMLIISHLNNSPMTDKQIKERALELGMVEADTTLNALVSDDAEEEIKEQVLEENEEPTSESAEEVVDEKASESDDGPSEEMNEMMATPTEEPVAEPTVEPTEEPKIIMMSDVESTPDKYLDDIEAKLNEADDYLNNKDKETAKPKASAKPVKSATPEPTKEPKATQKPTSTPKPTVEPTATPKPTEAPKVEAAGNNDGDGASLVIVSGESSFTVAKHLASLGVIENANTFDTYLCSIGADRKIRTGTFTIPKGSSEADIARIISGG